MTNHSEEKPGVPFAALDPRKDPATFNELETSPVVESLQDADEALSFLANHPHASQIAAEGTAIIEDPKRLKKLIWKIDWTIIPLLAATYFLQFLDKTTLSYTAVMGIRKDTHLVGQDYSDLSMLFYIGEQSNRKLGSSYSPRLRFPCVRISHPIPRTTFVSNIKVFGYQYINLGIHTSVACGLYEFRRPSYRARFSRRL